MKLKILMSALSLLVLSMGLVSCGDNEPEKVTFDKNLILEKTDVELDRGAAVTVAIEDGNGGYTLRSLDSEIATAVVEGDNVKVTGVTSGKTNIVITDSHGIQALMNVLVYLDLSISENDILLFYGDEDFGIEPMPHTFEITSGNGGYRLEYSNTDLDVTIDGNEVTLVANGAISNEQVTIYDRAGKSITFTVNSGHPIVDNEQLRLQFQGRTKLNADGGDGFDFYNRVVGSQREFGWREGHNYKTFYLRIADNDFSVGDKANVTIKFDFDEYKDGGGYISGFTAVDWAKVVKNDGTKFWMIFRFASHDKDNIGVIVQNIAAD